MFNALRNLIKIAILLLVANAAYQFVPTYVNYVQFKDAVKQTALFSKDVPNQALLARIMELADEHNVPIERNDVSISRQVASIYIDASYVQDIAFVPRWKYPWAFEVKVDALILSSSKPER